MLNKNEPFNPEGDLPKSASGAAAGFGTLLREAREKAGISQADLSNRLHLRMDVVRALEAERLADLPEPTYVRGYLRACARVFEISPQAFLEAFERQTSTAAPTPVIPVPTTPAAETLKPAPPAAAKPVPAVAEKAPPAETAPGPSPSLKIRKEWRINPYLIGAVLLLAIIVLVIFGFSGKSEPPDSMLDTPEATADEAERPAPLALPSPGIGVAPSLPALPTPAPAPVAPAPTASPETPPAAAPATEAVTPTPAPAAATPGPAPGQARIRLRFSEDSWVEIRDSAGNRVLVGLMRAGQERNLEAALPLRFVLGNTPGVQMELNGKAYDLAPHRRSGDSVARFTLER